MNHRTTFLSSFRAQLMLVFIVSMLAAGALSNFLIYQYSLDSQFQQLRDKLKAIAQIAALSVDGERVARIPLAPEGAASPEYRMLTAQLRRIADLNPPLISLYILRRSPAVPHRMVFAVDPVPWVRDVHRNKGKLFPGDVFPFDEFSVIEKAFHGPVADTTIHQDPHRKMITGYAPIYDQKGEPSAVIGVDILASDVYAAQEEMASRSTVVLFLCIALAIVLGLLYSRYVTRPIDELIKGTNNIAEGNLQYKVSVSSTNEIAGLAEAFNRMADNLYHSRRKLHNYFYNTIQALVRIMEARDSYTRGHSERVAEYAVQIAARMGVPLDRVELLRTAALLHDIGKLGINEEILNKKTPLSEEEWEAIRAHPAIGEEILKSVLLTDEMLAVIREHHERFDGTGYPAQLSGENIHFFASIVAVADAYDAMTSNRAYRPALDKRRAMEELRKQSGKQFNAKVVEIFLRILESDIA